MALISILMPVYNAERSIGTAIDSVLKQTFKEWELVCVDDDSNDQSLKILQKYAQLDKRIKVLHQKNTGPLGARRLGFEHSTGDYIIYLDADDLYSEDLLESLYNRAIESQADAIAPDMLVRYPDKDISWNKTKNIDITETLSPIEGFMETFPWNKLHNFNLWARKVFKKSTYHPYLENNNFNADEILQRILLMNCNKIVYTPKGAYIHTYNISSITHVLTQRSFSRLSANEKLIQLGIDYKLNEKQMNKIYSFAFFCQLKGLMLDYYKSKNSNINREWALKLMEKAYYQYTKYNLSNFYGVSSISKLKAKIQTINFSIFKLICKLQTYLHE